MSGLPASIHNAVIDGVQRLYVLRLDGAPADDTLPLTTQVWLDAIAWRRQWADDDLPRLQQAFVALTATAKRWPQPATLLEMLPPRPTPLALPTPRKSDAQRAEDASWLDEMLNMITGKMKVKKGNHEPGRNQRPQTTAAPAEPTAGSIGSHHPRMSGTGGADAATDTRGERQAP
nr:MAG TPA: hypothetical protein [Caudoviricetes sp.]